MPTTKPRKAYRLNRLSKRSPHRSRSHLKIERLETRRLLANDLGIASELSFESAIEGKELFIAKWNVTDGDGLEERFTIRRKAGENLHVYFDRFDGGAIGRSINLSRFRSTGESDYLGHIRRGSAATLRFSSNDTHELVFSDHGETIVDDVAIRAIALPDTIPFLSSTATQPSELQPTEHSQTRTATAAGWFSSGYGTSQTRRFTVRHIEAGATVDVDLVTPGFGTVTPTVSVLGPGAESPTPVAERFVAPTSGLYRFFVSYQATYDGKRYDAVSEHQHPQDWETVKRLVLPDGGDLVVINNDIENQLVGSFFPSVWLGAEVREGESPDDIEWLTGEPITYSDFLEGEPSKAGGIALERYSKEWHVPDNGQVAYGILESQIDSNTASNSFAGPDALFWIDVSVTDTTAPRIKSISGLPTNQLPSTVPIHTFTVAFTEPIVVESALEDAFSIRSSGDDEILGSSDDLFVPAIVHSIDPSTYRVEIVNEALTDGDYQLLINSIADLFGNAVDQPIEFEFSIDGISQNYIFEGLDNDTLQTATQLPLELDVNGTGWMRTERNGIGVSATADHDFWQINVSQGSEIQVHVINRANGTSLPASLLDQNAEIVDQQLSGRSEASLRHRVETDGTYFVQVSGGNNIVYDISVLVSTDAPINSMGEEFTSGRTAMRDRFVFSNSQNPRTAKIASTLTHSTTDGFEERFDLGTIQQGNDIIVTVQTPHWSSLDSTIQLTNGRNFVLLDEDLAGSIFRGRAFSDDDYRVVIQGLHGTGRQGQYVVEVEIDDKTPPSLTETTLPDTTIQELISDFSLRFDEPIGNLSGIDLREAGADHLFGTPDDRVHNATLSTDETRTQWTVEITDGPLANGNYQFTVQSVLDQSGNQLDPGYSRFFTIDAIGSHQVFEGLDNDVPQTATRLAIVSSQQVPTLSRTEMNGVGIIDSPGDTDWWVFDANEGDEYWIQLDGGSVYPRYLDGGELRNAQKPIPVYSTGPQYVEVRGAKGAQYNIGIILSQNGPFEQRTNHLPGQSETVHLRLAENDSPSLVASAAGTISTFNDVDFFELGRLEAGGNIHVAVGIPEWSTLHPELLISRDGGQSMVLPLNDQNHATFEIELTGEYSIGIGSLPPTEAIDESQYRLDFAVTNTQPLQVVGLSGLPTNSIAIDLPIAQFEIEFNQEITRSSLRSPRLTVVGAGVDRTFDTSDDTEYSYYIANEFDGLTANLKIRDAILRSGMYRLTISNEISSRYLNSFKDETPFTFEFQVDELVAEDYTIESENVDGRENALPLIPLESPTGSFIAKGIGAIDEEDDVDWWKFSANANDFVSLWNPSREMSRSTTFVVFDEFGEQVFSDVDRVPFYYLGSFEQYAIRDAGTYFVRVSDSGRTKTDGLYEIWMHLTPGYDRAGETNLELRYPATIVSQDRRYQLNVGQADTRSRPFNRDHNIQGEAGAELEARVLTPLWSPRSPMLTLSAGVVAPVSNVDSFSRHLRVSGGYSIDVMIGQNPQDSLSPFGFSFDTEYLLEFSLKDPIPPTLDAIRGIPDHPVQNLPSLQLQFSESVRAPQFADGIEILRNGVPITNSNLVLEDLGQGIVNLSNLSSVTSVDGDYELLIDLGFVASEETFALAEGIASVKWTVDNEPPILPVAVVTSGDESFLRLLENEPPNGEIETYSIYSIQANRLAHVGTYTNTFADIPLSDLELGTEFFAIARDHAGNRSTLDLRSHAFDEIIVSTSMLGNDLAILPQSIVTSPDTNIRWQGSWSVHHPILENNDRVHRVVALNQPIEFRQDPSSQNPVQRYDVDLNGLSTALDALIVINHLVRARESTFDVIDRLDVYLDVNGDGESTPSDALAIINRLSEEREHLFNTDLAPESEESLQVSPISMEADRKNRFSQQTDLREQFEIRLF